MQLLCLLGVMVFFYFLSVAVFMTAWNFVVPILWSGAPSLNFLQSMALMFLVAVLAGNIRISRTGKE